MKRNVIKVVAVLLIAIMAVTILNSAVFAANNEIKFDEINEDYVRNNASDNSGAAASVNRIIGSLLTVVQVVGSGVAVIMLIVLAIKYISAAPSDKAEIKKHAVVYVVGAVVLFAATGIIGIVRRFAGNVHAD